ncbi:unnamed protein product [Agarophyton chilense]
MVRVIPTTKQTCFSVTSDNFRFSASLLITLTTPHSVTKPPPLASGVPQNTSTGSNSATAFNSGSPSYPATLTFQYENPVTVGLHDSRQSATPLNPTSPIKILTVSSSPDAGSSISNSNPPHYEPSTAFSVPFSSAVSVTVSASLNGSVSAPSLTAMAVVPTSPHPSAAAIVASELSMTPIAAFVPSVAKRDSAPQNVTFHLEAASR